MRPTTFTAWEPKFKIKHLPIVKYIYMYIFGWFTMYACRAFRTAERFGRRCRRDETAAHDPLSKKRATKTTIQPPQGGILSRRFPRFTCRPCCHSRKEGHGRTHIGGAVRSFTGKASKRIICSLVRTSSSSTNTVDWGDAWGRTSLEGKRLDTCTKPSKTPSVNAVSRVRYIPLR